MALVREFSAPVRMRVLSWFVFDSGIVWRWLGGVVATRARSDIDAFPEHANAGEEGPVHPASGRVDAVGELA
ncbi:hypothetical protein ACWDN6_15350 [Streptomyces albogriseolus]|uniref:hypothetical protein n=1 Tax=Streptomyces albogriseolus TaxID=1887 RepID=UPI00296EA525